jgi:hypothetical protein
MISTYLIDATGWTGSAAVVGAYALLSTNKLDSKSRMFQLLNLIGGVCLVINTSYYGAYPSTFVNVVWAAIALTALSRMNLRLAGKDDGPTAP